MAHKLSREDWCDKTKLTLSSYQHYLTPLMLKMCRKSVDLSPKSFFMDVDTTFRHLLAMFVPWRSQKSLCKHKDPITGNSFIWVRSRVTLQILGPSRVKQKPFATLFWITDSFSVWYSLTRYRLSSEPWKLLLHFASKCFILNWITPVSSGVGIHK